MYGKNVILDLGDDIVCEVFVLCTPDTTEEELRERAIKKLMNRLNYK